MPSDGHARNRNSTLWISALLSKRDTRSNRSLRAPRDAKREHVPAFEDVASPRVARARERHGVTEHLRDDGARDRAHEIRMTKELCLEERRAVGEGLDEDLAVRAIGLP